MPEPYASVVSNLFDTGLHQVIFKTVQGPALMGVTAADFADSVALEAMVERTKHAGSLGTMVNERASMDLLRDVCRHGSNPWQLVDFASYQPTHFDLAVCAHGSLDGSRAIWDQLIVPNLTRLGISVDPGVVPPTPGRPDPGDINAPLPAGQQDPAMKALSLALAALRSIESFNIAVSVGTPPSLQAVPITSTDTWKAQVAPLLAGPFMSGV